MTIKRWMDKENVVSTYSGILFCLKKDEASWLYQKDFRQSGISEFHKYCMIPFVGGI